jgi:L-seryl-tRNA(Ser) seleniumtransferase
MKEDYYFNDPPTRPLRGEGVSHTPFPLPPSPSLREGERKKESFRESPPSLKVDITPSLCYKISMDINTLLKGLPSVDEVLKSRYGEKWLKEYPRPFLLRAIREAIEHAREDIRTGKEDAETSIEALAPHMEAHAKKLSSLSLRPLINATGIVIHTNLGRSLLSDRALENVLLTSSSYTNLEYDIEEGKRGKRYSHIKRLLREATGAEDGLIVNNNAAAVFLTLNTLAKGREVIVSRGELVEIGGSFRVPDVMASSGAVLKEVGTTNKTHIYDYERAMNENTALILKVHRSNFRIAGFTEDVGIEKLCSLGGKRNIPVMFDLGSGSLIDLKPYGIHTEPSVKDVVRGGVDIVTFSGDKLLGGPQAGAIAGKKIHIEKIQKNPITRALRVDKMTLSAFEATLMEYVDEERAKKEIPTLRMLLEEPASIKKRAKHIEASLKRHIKDAKIKVVEDYSQAGGGALPEVNLLTYVVSVTPEGISTARLEERLRKGEPPVVARIKENALILDSRTIRDNEIKTLIGCMRAALGR